jgi:hypothetical protein
MKKGAAHARSERGFARTICAQLTKAGAPDMYNYVPTRPVLPDEASQHGWHMFWDGQTACAQGHIGARYIVNHAMCSDCNRVNNGKTPIYPNKNGSDLTTDAPTYVEPIADAKFVWTEPKKVQFLTALINSADVMQALAAIKAQPSHLIAYFDANPAFKSEFDRVRATSVALVQLWKTEALAVGGSERAALVMGANKFAEFGQKTTMNRSQSGSPEQIRAEFNQILRGLGVPSAAGAATQVRADAEVHPGAALDSDGSTGAGDRQPYEAGSLLTEDDANCDLVS